MTGLQTRAVNKSVHPGNAIPKQFRRTKAQIEADKKEKAAQDAAKKQEAEEERARGVGGLGAIEDRIRQTEANKIEQASRPTPSNIKKVPRRVARVDSLPQRARSSSKSSIEKEVEELGPAVSMKHC